jgi:hypothetical protein
VKKKYYLILFLVDSLAMIAYIYKYEVGSYDRRPVMRTAPTSCLTTREVETMSNKQCVGCGSATEGVYRPDANWNLCDECYEVWKEEQVANREEEYA